jgi:hypothetical protein
MPTTSLWFQHERDARRFLDAMRERVSTGAPHTIVRCQSARNRPTRSKVRPRVEHVFGHQQSSMGGKIVRTIGIVRAKFKIGMMNLGYNIRRLPQLKRVAAAPA